MRKKDISDAIGNINDRYIEEAADFQRKKKRTGKSSILQKSVAAAASFILVFIIICFDIGSCGFFSGL